ncbi:uncharacterized protein FFB20_10446 [Fusarium fujikuroi]|uniref:Uncharacterized protein n=1 Tax=Fusarium fujikuroi TaxID=5127 RepID=A0A2H3S3T9_FUSFU|nr:uncharacterized protein Y057_12177 [Fusarium fujikuroi]SCN97610.1 uncharacterized protein FFB20_10446 [Fusarium fujikuroi]SCO11125.1 uncharacterized protein FFC1_11390 [Fusarium fujikuroi]SCO40795.1 uncharacterized protein FFNC_07688 [Fusarium fujikuroi]SCV57837.1 uncharacterized protein FFFS_12909 [Fusarium fujikuroi]
MVSQLHYDHLPSTDAPWASLVSNSMLPRVRWRRLRQKFSRHRLQKAVRMNTSSTTVESSDTNLKYRAVFPQRRPGPSRAGTRWFGGVNRSPPLIFRPAKFLRKLIPQPATPTHGHYKTHGNASHRVASKKVVKSGHKGKGTGKDSQKSGPSSGGKGGKGKGGNNSQPPPNGYRFPPLLDDTRPPKTFGCPFYISDPLQFHDCSSLRLRRSSDVSQHLMRSHLLRTMRFVRRRDTESTERAESEESMQQDGTCVNPNGIRLYHQLCRMEFNGPNAEESLQDHCNNTMCYKAGIEETGVMLPAEFRALIAARDSVPGGVAKWYAMWAVCFPPLITTRFRTVPASPYVETTVPRELGEYTIRQALSNRLMGDQSLVTDQIVNQIYLGDTQTDFEVQQTVQDHQQERDLELQRADYEAFYQQASSQQAEDWTWDSLPPNQHGGPQ